jgi:DNA repair protein RadD
MPKQLRKYQEAANKAIWHHIYNAQGYPLIVAPVGAGKSLIMAEFIRQVQEKYSRTRIIVLAHDKELLVQNSEELRAQYPEANYGFYCSGLNQKKLTNDITFASIQSIHDKAMLLDETRRPNIIIVDECHTIPHNDETRYRKFIADCEALNPKMRVIGLTGTPYRSDSGHLCEGKGALFESVAYEIPIAWMIEEGFLVKPTVPKTTTIMDTSGVKTRNGDYIESQLQAAIDKQDVTEACVKEIIEHGQDRKRWLIFTAGTDHCEHVTAEIQRHGVKCQGIHSKRSAADNKAAVLAFRNGDIQCLVNVAMLTTGFNVPEIDMLAFMRPTRSPVLYVQCIGRGIRPVYAAGMPQDTKEQRLDAIAASGKADCMVLDFGGVIDALGCIDDIKVTKRQSDFEPKLKDEKKEQARICPACGELNAMTAKHCIPCGFQLIADVVTLSESADKKNALLTADIEPETLAVIDWMLSKHVKKTKDGEPPAKPILKVVYNTYAGNIYEWVAMFKMKEWHDRHMPEHKGMHPQSVDDALFFHCENTLPYKMPEKIIVKKFGKFLELKGKIFGERPMPLEGANDITY